MILFVNVFSKIEWLGNSVQNFIVAQFGLSSILEVPLDKILSKSVILLLIISDWMNVAEAD